MQQIGDFYWLDENKKEFPAKEMVLEYVYTPAFRFWVKDPELDTPASPLMCIKCYRVTSPGGLVAHIQIAEHFSENNMIETFWISCTNEYLHVHDIYYGELTRETPEK